MAASFEPPYPSYLGQTTVHCVNQPYSLSQEFGVKSNSKLSQTLFLELWHKKSLMEIIRLRNKWAGERISNWVDRCPGELRSVLQQGTGKTWLGDTKRNNKSGQAFNFFPKPSSIYSPWYGRLISLKLRSVYYFPA